MDVKRILTAVIGLPLVTLILIFGNTYVIDVLMMILAVICMNEYYVVISKIAHPIKWVGYLSTVIIALVSVLNITNTLTTAIFSIPFIILILFLHVIITNMETTFKDVAYTFLGIFYITFFIMFLSIIRETENGQILLGYTISVAWGTDIFAYLIGKKWGKHKFSKVSPKKSIEGCIGGIIGAILISLIYVYVLKTIGVEAAILKTSYIYITIASLVLSIISQIGDFVASSIKRFADIKDYGNLLPGHGGMLDRVDSLIFIAPFSYMIFILISII